MLEGGVRLCAPAEGADSGKQLAVISQGTADLGIEEGSALCEGKRGTLSGPQTSWQVMKVERYA